MIISRLISKIIFASLIVTGAAFILVACTSNPANSTSARAQVLEAQIDDLDRELMLIHSATGDDQLALMHQYWDMLQKQLAYVRDLPGVHRGDCTDWTFQDSHFAGQSSFNNSKPCLSLHGSEPSAFAFPDKMTPRLFELTMGQQLDILRAQVLGIQDEKDVVARQDLLRQNYETRYQDIQTILGRGWMWTTHDPSTLPDPNSMGAQLLTRYCSQCHLAPTPNLRTRAEWAYITGRMHDIIGIQTQDNPTSGIRMPSLDELTAITSYLESHAGN